MALGSIVDPVRTTFAMAALQLVTTGCAGSRLPAADARLGHYQGRAVKSVTLKGGDSIVFDAWDSAGPGTDKRARIRDDAVIGYVDGR